MRHLRFRRSLVTAKAGVLAIAVLAGGGAYGAGPASAAETGGASTTGVASTASARAGAASAGTASGATATGEVRAPSPEAEARRRLRALEASFAGRIGAYAIDTATGETIGYRSGERFPLLSTFKAVACAAVLHKARTSDPGLMDRVIHWTKDEVVENSPVTEKHVEDGMTVAALCHAAITVSDNTAGNMVLKQIGGPRGLTRYFRTLKDPVSRLDRWETELNDWTLKEKRDTTTPAAMARDLSKVAAGTTLRAADRAQLNAWLRASETGNERIRAGLPQSWIVGDKTGTNATAGLANDVAVVVTSAGAAPVIVTVYTNGKAAGTPSGNKVIAETATILARGLGKLP
ncbi:class A beta-lactamase [Sphaerisporangium dianthi]|uniref:Beta-lactamase n=1 Tax=Sphaerisporangium dianthi TaxID=1436120 RepID=A0ABV9C9N9_9ACTN